MQKIKVLLFDLGGVLVDWDGTTPLVEMTGGRLNREAARQFWLTSPWVGRHDTGACNVQEFAVGARQELHLDIEQEAFISAYRSWVKGVYPGVHALLERLSQHYQLATLTNNNAEHFDRITHDLDLGHYFSQVFASHLLGMSDSGTPVFTSPAFSTSVAPPLARTSARMPSIRVFCAANPS